MAKTLNLALTLLLLLHSSQILAEDEQSPRWYEVEIILFEYQPDQQPITEQLSSQAEIPNLSNTIDLLPENSVQDRQGHSREQPYQRLPAESLQLTQTARRLERGRDYTLLLHTGWRQPGLGKDLAPNILIAPHTETSLESRHIFGTVRLILSRYLHIEADLLLADPAPPLHTTDSETILQTAGPKYYRLNETRRIKKNELHFFDHPKFGMIVVVRDYQPPVEQIEEPSPAEVETTSAPDNSRTVKH